MNIRASHHAILERIDRELALQSQSTTERVAQVRPGGVVIAHSWAIPGFPDLEVGKFVTRCQQRVNLGLTFGLSNLAQRLITFALPSIDVIDGLSTACQPV